MPPLPLVDRNTLNRPELSKRLQSKTSRQEKGGKLDQVNNANSAIILINCLISQGCKSCSIGQGSPFVPRGPCGKSGQGGQLG